MIAFIVVIFFCLAVAGYVSAIFALAQWRVHRKAGLMVLAVIQFVQVSLPYLLAVFTDYPNHDLLVILALSCFAAVFGVALYMLCKYRQAMFKVWSVSVLSSLGVVVAWSYNFWSYYSMDDYITFLLFVGMFNCLTVATITIIWVYRRERCLLLLAGLLLLQALTPAVVFAAWNLGGFDASFEGFMIAMIMGTAFFTLCIFFCMYSLLGRGRIVNALYVCALLSSMLTPPWAGAVIMGIAGASC